MNISVHLFSKSSYKFQCIGTEQHSLHRFPALPLLIQSVEEIEKSKMARIKWLYGTTAFWNFWLFNPVLFPVYILKLLKIVVLRFLSYFFYIEFSNLYTSHVFWLSCLSALEKKVHSSVAVIKSEQDKKMKKAVFTSVCSFCYFSVHWCHQSRQIFSPNSSVSGCRWQLLMLWKFK